MCFVVAGVVLTAVGVYKPLVDFGGAGATVPLLGFGYSLAMGAIEAVNKYGILGHFLRGRYPHGGGHFRGGAVWTFERADFQAPRQGIEKIPPGDRQCRRGLSADEGKAWGTTSSDLAALGHLPQRGRRRISHRILIGNQAGDFYLFLLTGLPGSGRDRSRRGHGGTGRRR